MKCVRPFIAALVDNLEEIFPEDSIAVMDAADVFDPIKAASSSSPESRYKYGRNEVSNLAEHKLEHTTVLTEWKEFSTTLSQFNNAQDVLISLVKQQKVFPNLAHIASSLLVIPVPVHSADCEHGFSAMGRIKTKL